MDHKIHLKIVWLINQKSTITLNTHKPNYRIPKSMKMGGGGITSTLCTLSYINALLLATGVNRWGENFRKDTDT